MDLVITLVVGGIIGWLASIVMKTNAQMGILMNVLVGIGGAFLGHWLAPMLGLAPEGTFGMILVSLGGAVLVILILKLLKVLR